MRHAIRPSIDPRARWRVAVLAAPDDALRPLRDAIANAGGHVALELPPRVNCLRALGDAAIDVIVLRPPRAAGAHPDLVSFTTAGHPIVLYTPDTSRALLARAARAGVMALLVEPLHPPQLAATLDLAVARFGDCEALRRKLADRKVIERAKGRLMALASVTEEDAFRWLRTSAMHARRHLVDVARAVIEAAPADGSPPAEGSPVAGERAMDPHPEAVKRLDGVLASISLPGLRRLPDISALRTAASSGAPPRRFATVIQRSHRG